MKKNKKGFTMVIGESIIELGLPKEVKTGSFVHYEFKKNDKNILCFEKKQFINMLAQGIVAITKEGRN